MQAPTRGFSGNGVAVIYPVANTPDLTLVTIQPPAFLVAPYTVSLFDGNGKKVDGGDFLETTGGALLWWDLSGHDLSKVASIVVVPGGVPLVQYAALLAGSDTGAARADRADGRRAAGAVALGRDRKLWSSS